MFRYVYIFCAIFFLGIPYADAAIGISPSTIEATLVQDSSEDRILTITRDAEDTPYDMYVSVFSDDGFLVTEGVTYFMGKGQTELHVPYRISSESYGLGTYTGTLFVRPQRVTSVQTTGVQFIIQGGVRAKLHVTDTEQLIPSWYDKVLQRAHAHIHIYAVTAADMAHEVRAVLEGIFE